MEVASQAGLPHLSQKRRILIERQYRAELCELWLQIAYGDKVLNSSTLATIAYLELGIQQQNVQAISKAQHDIHGNDDGLRDAEDKVRMAIKQSFPRSRVPLGTECRTSRFDEAQIENWFEVIQEVPPGIRVGTVLPLDFALPDDSNPEPPHTHETSPPKKMDADPPDEHSELQRVHDELILGKGRILPAFLKYMMNRDRAEYGDLAHDVWDDDQLDDGAIRRTVNRANRELEARAASTRFRVANRYVHKAVES